MSIHSIVYFPDEWLYTGLSRSVFDGPFAHIHGARLSPWEVISYVGPVLTSPLWLLSNISLAHHLSQAVASVAFASAVFPTYALARRLGVDERASLATAAVAQLIPAGVFTSTMLAEPYAYPVFLVAALVALDALASPTIPRVAALFAMSVLLVVTGGLQFLVFPPIVVAAWILSGRPARAMAGRTLIVGVAAAVGLLLLELGGAGHIVRRVVDSATGQNYDFRNLAPWSGVNLFVLAIGSGWILIPVAAVGIWRLLLSSDAVDRTFATLTICVVAGLVAEAGLWSTNGNGIYERFTFYATPLVVVAFQRESASRAASRAPYALIAYASVAAAILMPLSARVGGNSGHSPTMFALDGGLLFDVARASLIWVPVLAVLGLAAAAIGGSRPAVLVGVSAVFLLWLTASSAKTLDRHDSNATPHVAIGDGTLLVNPVVPAYEFSGMRLLFWSPGIKRLAVVGGGPSPDALPAATARLAASDRVVTDRGTTLRPPFAVPQTTTAWRNGHVLVAGGPGLLPGTPDTIAFGWGRGGLLANVVELAAAGDDSRPRHLTVRLEAEHGRATVATRCIHSRRMVVDLATTPRAIAIHVPAGGSQRCRLVVVTRGASTRIRATLTAA